MEQIKAVEMMRKIRNEIDKEYKGFSIAERVKMIHEELESDPFWKKFIEERRPIHH